jgi:hypothetical protein
MPLPAILTLHARPMGGLAPSSAPLLPSPGPAGGALPDQSNGLAFTMQAQAQSNWCWAAVAVSVSLFHNAASSWVQCRLVEAELGQTTCCRNGSSGVCNVPWYLDRALTRTANFVRIGAGIISFRDIIALVNGGEPLGVRIGWSGGGGHFVAVVGYAVAAGVEYVDVEDPFFGSSTQTFVDFQTRYQSTGAWTHSYWTQP